MEELLLLLGGIYPLSEPLVLHLADILKVLELKKGEFLLKEGRISSKVCFIAKGMIRCFYQKENKEVSNWFMQEGDVIFSVESFYTQTPAYESIEALEDSFIYYINYDELQHIYRTYSEFNFIARVLTEQYYRRCEKRLREIRMQSAVERFSHLQNEHPDLMLRVAAKHLASYLGISEETFSRIKSTHWR